MGVGGERTLEDIFQNLIKMDISFTYQGEFDSDPFEKQSNFTANYQISAQKPEFTRKIRKFR